MKRIFVLLLLSVFASTAFAGEIISSCDFAQELEETEGIFGTMIVSHSDSGYRMNLSLYTEDVAEAVATEHKRLEKQNADSETWERQMEAAELANVNPEDIAAIDYYWSLVDGLGFNDAVMLISLRDSADRELGKVAVIGYLPLACK